MARLKLGRTQPENMISSLRDQAALMIDSQGWQKKKETEDVILWFGGLLKVRWRIVRRKLGERGTSRISLKGGTE